MLLLELDVSACPTKQSPYPTMRFAKEAMRVLRGTGFKSPSFRHLVVVPRLPSAANVAVLAAAMAVAQAPNSGFVSG